MKKIYTIAILLLFAGIAYSQKIKENEFEYAKDVKLSVVMVKRPRVMEFGGGAHGLYIPKSKDDRFVRIFLEISNKSAEDIIVDFEKMFLLYANEKYKVETAMQNMDSRTDKFQKKLRAGKKKQYMVDFLALLPKDAPIGSIVVNDQVVSFEPEE